MEVLGSAAQCLGCCLGSGERLWICLTSIIPHRQAAIVAAAFLCDHLLPANMLQCFHGRGPLIQLREKRMRGVLMDAPRQEALARARPDPSWLRSPDRETCRKNLQVRVAFWLTQDGSCYLRSASKTSDGPGSRQCSRSNTLRSVWDRAILITAKTAPAPGSRLAWW